MERVRALVVAGTLGVGSVVSGPVLAQDAPAPPPATALPAPVVDPAATVASVDTTNPHELAPHVSRPAPTAAPAAAPAPKPAPVPAKVALAAPQPQPPATVSSAPQAPAPTPAGPVAPVDHDPWARPYFVKGD